MIQSYNNFINESVKTLKHVYHVLDIDKLKYVLQNNKITSYKFTNISTSRNKYFSNYVGDSVTSWFKLELDYQKLNKNYKNRAFVFISRTNVSMPEEDEQQFLTQEISPAFDYITKVILIKSRLEKSMYNVDNKFSDWMTDAPRPKRKIPTIIAEFVEMLKKLNMKLYVQDFDGTIKEDDAYLEKIIKHPLKHVDIYYAYAYRKNKFKKRFTYEDVIYDPIILKDHVLVIGYKYPKKDFICLANSVEELQEKYPTLEKEIKHQAILSKDDLQYYTKMGLQHENDADSYLPIEESKLNVLTFRDVGQMYYLEDIKPYDWN